MMVLKRTVGQSFYIGDDIRIQIRSIQKGNYVRFAIDAPIEIPVNRLEIHELIQAENRAASASTEAFFNKHKGKEK